MPWNDAEPTDPHEIVGVSLPASREALVEMAYAFAEEYAALGFGEAQIERLFHAPRFAAPSALRDTLGDERIRAIVREASALYGRVRFVVRDAPLLVPLRRLRRNG
jgi:hypothetical protein